MLSEIEQFQKWLRCRVPHGGTHIHYVSDLELFFLWLPKPVATVNVRDVDAFIEHCQAKGHAIATINRRVAALCSFYYFLAMMSDDAPSNPVHPQRNFIRQGSACRAMRKTRIWRACSWSSNHAVIVRCSY